MNESRKIFSNYFFWLVSQQQFHYRTDVNDEAGVVQCKDNIVEVLYKRSIFFLRPFQRLFYDFVFRDIYQKSLVR